MTASYSSLRTMLPRRSGGAGSVLSASLARRHLTIDNSAKAAGTQAVQQCRLITAIKTPFLPDGKIDIVRRMRANEG